MLQLIMKELMIQKRQKTVLIALILGVTVGFVFPSSPGLGSLQVLLGVYMMVVYANAFDFKYNAEVLFNSLPLGRRQIVIAKYLSAFVFAAIMFVIALVSNSVMKIFMELPEVPIRTGTNIFSFILLAVFILSIYLSIYYPIYFKFGYMSSRWANFIAMFVLFGFMGGIGEVYDAKAETGFASAGSPLDQLFAVLSGTADSIMYLTLLGLGFLLLLISMNLSVWVYKRKEL